MLALRYFGISEHSSDIQNITCSNYSLCEVSVEHGGLVKQKRLPETALNLSERIGVHSRWPSYPLFPASRFLLATGLTPVMRL